MPTTPPSITALPTPPDPNDRTTFNTRAYPWSVAQQTLATEVGDVAANVFSNATEATEAAARALPAAAAAEAASNATQWVSGTTYAAGDVVWSPINALSYRRKSAGAGTTDPSADSANWASLAVPSLLRSARTSNTVLGVGDKGAMIDITSGTFTQTFAAAATLGDGWFCYLRNGGTGVVTLDPNAAETIDGASTKSLDPMQTVVVQCDGTALRTVALSGAGNHSVVVHTGNGLGSTATQIRRFTTAMTNVGSAITYADSAGDGASFTINEQGVYSIFYSDQASAITDLPIGISLNSAELTTSVNTISVASRLALSVLTGAPSFVSVVARLSVGDVVRPHTTGAATGTSNATYFAIQKVGI